MSKFIYILTFSVFLFSNSAEANQSVEGFIKEKRLKAAQIQTLSKKKVTRYKSLISQGKTIVSDIRYTATRKPTAIISSDTPITSLETASGENSDGNAITAPVGPGGSKAR